MSKEIEMKTKPVVSLFAAAAFVATLLAIPPSGFAQNPNDPYAAPPLPMGDQDPNMAPPMDDSAQPYQPPMESEPQAMPQASTMGDTSSDNIQNMVQDQMGGGGSGSKRAAFLAPLLGMFAETLIKNIGGSLLGSMSNSMSGNMGGNMGGSMNSAAPQAGYAQQPQQQGGYNPPPSEAAPEGYDNSGAQAVGQPVAHNPMSVVQDEVPAGLAYEIYIIGLNKKENLVHPSRFAFKNGDRFIIRFASNLPGVVVGYNIDPNKVKTKVGTWEVAGGDPLRLPAKGSFKFVGGAGEEILQFQLYPCQSLSHKQAVSDYQSGKRAIVVAEDVAEVLPTCQNINNQGIVDGKRAIVVEEDGNTGIGVSYMSQQQLASGEPQVLQIKFIHQ